MLNIFALCAFWKKSENHLIHGARDILGDDQVKLDGARLEMFDANGKLLLYIIGVVGHGEIDLITNGDGPLNVEHLEKRTFMRVCDQLSVG